MKAQATRTGGYRKADTYSLLVEEAGSGNSSPLLLFQTQENLEKKRMIPTRARNTEMLCQECSHIPLDLFLPKWGSAR